MTNKIFNFPFEFDEDLFWKQVSKGNLTFKESLFSGIDCTNLGFSCSKGCPFLDVNKRSCNISEYKGTTVNVYLDKIREIYPEYMI